MSAATTRRWRSCSWPGRAASPWSTRWPSTCAASRPLFDGPGLAVVHAAQQDLDVLTRTCGTDPGPAVRHPAGGRLRRPRHAVAGQPPGRRAGPEAAQGRPPVGLAAAPAVGQPAVLRGRRRRPPPRAPRPASWPSWRSSGRLSWALDECEELRTRPTGPGDPDDAWLKLKDVRTLRSRSRGVARSVAAWRERRAAELDLPVRFVLPDLAILGIAQRPPATVEELRSTRGVEDRHARGTTAAELLAAVADGLDHPVELPEQNGDELDRHLRPAVTLVSAWVSQLARDQRIDTALLATRADLVDLLRGDPDARLAHGWRAATVGDDIRHLVAGEAALAFDGHGGLKLLDPLTDGRAATAQAYWA